MKRILLIGGLLAALLCLAQNASAQYARIHRDGAGFVDNRGMTLTDDALIDLIGEDVFFDTVIGARKQYNAGRKLITGGLIGIGAGYLAASLGTYMLVASSENSVRYYSANDNYPYRYDYDDPDPLQAVTGALLAAGGYVALFSGYCALNAGIPLKIIGKSRLNWVENDFNDRARGYSLQFGPAPSGLGLTLTF